MIAEFAHEPRRPYSLALTAERYARFPEVVDLFDGAAYRRLLFSGRRRALTSRSLLGALITLPFLTFKVIAAIHWEAIRLWLKGVPYVPRPNPSQM